LINLFKISEKDILNSGRKSSNLQRRNTVFVKIKINLDIQMEISMKKDRNDFAGYWIT